MRWGAKDAQQNSYKMSGRGIAIRKKNPHRFHLIEADRPPEAVLGEACPSQGPFIPVNESESQHAGSELFIYHLVLRYLG